MDGWAMVLSKPTCAVTADSDIPLLFRGAPGIVLFRPVFSVQSFLQPLWQSCRTSTVCRRPVRLQWRKSHGLIKCCCWYWPCDIVWCFADTVSLEIICFPSLYCIIQKREPNVHIYNFVFLQVFVSKIPTCWYIKQHKCCQNSTSLANLIAIWKQKVVPRIKIRQCTEC